jgi:hypothetical protein
LSYFDLIRQELNTVGADGLWLIKAKFLMTQTAESSADEGSDGKRLRKDEMQLGCTPVDMY